MTMASDTTLERPLPHNLEAERSILGAVLLDNHSLNTAVETLRSEDFFLPQNRHIFERMIQLGEKQQAIDTVTLVEELMRKGQLEAAGGISYVSQLMDGLPRVTNVDHYARIVKEKAILRGLIHSASAIQEEALAAGDISVMPQQLYRRHPRRSSSRRQPPATCPAPLEARWRQ